MAKRTRLRIVNEGDIVGQRTRILIVGEDEDGEEVVTDVTHDFRVTRIGVDLTAGAVARATLECICVHGEINAILDDIVVRHVGRTRFGPLRWRLRKWWWRVR